MAITYEKTKDIFDKLGITKTGEAPCDTFVDNKRVENSVETVFSMPVSFSIVDITWEQLNNKKDLIDYIKLSLMEQMSLKYDLLDELSENK